MTILIVLATVLGLEAVSLVGLYFVLQRPEVAARVRYLVNKYLGNYHTLERAEAAVRDITMLKAGHNQLSENLQGLAQNDSEIADRLENLSHSISEIDESIVGRIKYQIDMRLNAEKKNKKAKKRTARR